MKINNIRVKIVAIVIYSCIAIALRYFFVIFKPSFLLPIHDSLVYNVLTGIGPLIAALFVVIVLKRKMGYSTFGNSLTKSIISTVVPITLFFIYDLFIGDSLFTNTLIVITCIIYSFCEEYGWRGYLQSELINLPTLRRVSIITLIWFIWHLNFSVTQSNAVFLILLFFGSWGIGLIAIKTKSILLCACFHAVINIISNIEMNLITIILLALSIMSWFGIWFVIKPNKCKT